MLDYKEIAIALLKKNETALTDTETHVLQILKEREAISRNVHKDFTDDMTFGQRVADRVAAFGGSWTFIGIFALIIILWIAGNTVLLMMFHKKPMDPFPFILLNLFLSMVAALQAPVIMMSQNRQAVHDRLNAQHDYAVNLKAEIEIVALHQKMDELREQQLKEMLELQKHQIVLLEQITIKQ